MRWHVRRRPGAVLVTSNDKVCDRAGNMSNLLGVGSGTLCRYLICFFFGVGRYGELGFLVQQLIF